MDVLIEAEIRPSGLRYREKGRQPHPRQSPACCRYAGQCMITTLGSISSRYWAVYDHDTGQYMITTLGSI